jgi:hypothetical protein
MSKKGMAFIILLGIGLLAIIFLGVFRKIARAFGNFNRSGELALPSTHSMSSEDSNLIAKQYIWKCHTHEIYNTKGREPVSLILFDKKYYLKFQ